MQVVNVKDPLAVENHRRVSGKADAWAKLIHASPSILLPSFTFSEPSWVASGRASSVKSCQVQG